MDHPNALLRCLKSIKTLSISESLRRAGVELDIIEKVMKRVNYVELSDGETFDISDNKVGYVKIASGLVLEKIQTGPAEFVTSAIWPVGYHLTNKCHVNKFLSRNLLESRRTTTLAVINSDALYQFACESKRFYEWSMRVYNESSSSMHECLVLKNKIGANETLFLFLTMIFSALSKRGLYTLHVKQSELCDIFGFSRQHLSRLLSPLQNSNVIKLGYGSLTCLNLQNLIEMNSLQNLELLVKYHSKDYRSPLQW